MFEKESHTPKSWITATLDQICSHPQYGWTCKACSGGDVKLLRTTDISSGTIDWATVPFCTEIPKKETDYHLTEGDIVVSRAGSVGKSFIIKGSVPRAVFASYLVRFKPYIERLYVYYFMQSRMYWEQIEEKSAGIAVPNVNGSKLAKIVLPVAPLNEQKRIVDKIEQLFSNLDEGEVLLKQVQKQLSTYRQSVLKAAVTGELTKEWREANKHRLESGDALLKRILKARRDNWDGRGKYKEPEVPDTSNLPEIPEEWTWGTLPQLGEFGRGKSKHRPRNDPKLYDGGTYPFLQTGTVRNSRGRIKSYDALYNDLGLKQSMLWPAGTICITIAANIAESGILEIDACFPDSIVGLIPSQNLFGKYIEFFIRTARSELDRYAPATAQKNINLEILGKVAVPLPPVEEQEEIVSKVDDIFSQIDALESWCESELSRSATLRQSILKDAFSGKLVPQAPDDEPASELLKRIQAERAKTTKQKSSASPRPRGRRKIKESI